MKLLYCQDCGDIIAPLPVALEPRYCRCRRHAVWWIDPRAGTLRVCDTQGRDGNLAGYPLVGNASARAYVIGLTNLLLGCPGTIDAETITEIIDAHDDNYIFKQIRSCVIRIRPGQSGDTSWGPLPT